MQATSSSAGLVWEAGRPGSREEGLPASVLSPSPLPVVPRISSSFEVDGGTFLVSYLDSS